MTLQLLLLLVGVSAINALDVPETVAEGVCDSSKLTPVPFKREIIDTFQHAYIASKYIMYSLAQGLPNYANLTEEDVINEGCYRRNTSTTDLSKPAAFFGFGKILSVATLTTPPDTYLKATPTVPKLAGDTLTDVLTMTDHKTFAFLVNCWNGRNRRSFGVVTPNNDPLSEETMAIIKEHAISLGFDEEKFMTFNRSQCDKQQEEEESTSTATTTTTTTTTTTSTTASSVSTPQRGNGRGGGFFRRIGNLFG